MILASLSLLLAAFVGLVTVPYLARRVAFERLRETLDYEVTKVGVVYVLVTLVIGIAALNTANNLLYLVVAAMLAAILVSGVVSALVLRGLELEVRLPEHVFAGQPVVGRIVLRNPRRFLPSFSIRVVAARRKKKTGKQWRWEPTTFLFSAASLCRKSVAKNARLACDPSERDSAWRGNFRRDGLFPVLAAGSAVTRGVRTAF